METTKRNIKVIENDLNCSTIEIDDEDHTLGNSLRYMITKDPNVAFCGYSMPHPNERRVILQIQTKKDTITPLDAFKRALSNLVDLCSHVRTTFESACEEKPMAVKVKREPDSDMDC